MWNLFHRRPTLTFNPEQWNQFMSGLTDLQAAVDANTKSVNSAVAAFQTIAVAGDPDGQVGALAATLATNNAALDAAVTAATPPAPAPA